MTVRDRDVPGTPPTAATDLPDLSSEATPLYGGRYQILSLIGAGGSGSVYRVRDVELDELVALKVLRKELLDVPETVERFRNEVRLARRVTHRNVARVFDIGEHHGERYLTMELVDGEPLSRRIGKSQGEGGGRPLPLASVADLVEQVCAGLEAAHQSGVVHCDLKPDNLLITRDAQGERVVITDFGIARAFAQGPTQSRDPRRFDGTPMYIAPESIEGGRIDSRADLYSLGVVLYELLTGAPPFAGESAVAVVAARVLRPPPDPRQARPALPAAVAQVVLRCLNRDPAQRYQRAAELATALRQAAQAVAEEPTMIRGRSTPKLAAAPVAPRRTPTAEELPVNPRAVAPLPVASDQRVVVVLPLRNQGAAEDEYLADGLSQELVDAVAALRGVRALGRGAVLRFGRTADPLAIGRSLGAALIVAGTLQRSGDRLRIELRVERVADGQKVYAQRFDCAAAELLRVSEALAAAVADALAIERPAPRAPLPAQDDAVERYLRARHLYGRSEQVSSAEAARLFEAVLAQAPSEPTLLMNCALARARTWFFGDGAAGERARAVAERAVAAAPQRGESHLALAVVHFQGAELAAAARALLSAIAHAPELADAHDLLGRILIETGPVREGLQHLLHARALDPGLFRTLVDQARIAALLGDYDQAHALLADPQFDGMTFGGQWMMRGRLCVWSRDVRRAEQYLQHPDMQRGLYPRARLSFQIVANKLRIDPKEILFEGQGADRSSPRGRAFFYQIHAEIFSFYGERELAVRSLARSVDAGFSDLLLFDRCPVIVSLAQDPRLGALRRFVFARAQAVREVFERRRLPIST